VKLTETGESRVNGYLFVLERSLKTFLAPDTVRDAVREIESHLRERVMAADGAPNEREAIERILAELGPPLRVAQAYSAERTIEEAVTTGHFVPMMRAVAHLALTTMTGFWAAFGLLVGYMVSFAFIAIAVLKPIFPANVGVDYVHGFPIGLSARFPLPPGTELGGGYWVIPFSLLCGLGIFVGTHRGARKFLAWRRETARGARGSMERS
jgi:HAAS domain-containing protein